MSSSSSSSNSASQQPKSPTHDNAVLTQTDSLLEIEEAASAASAVHSLDASEDDRSDDSSIAVVKILPPSDRNLQPKAAAVEYVDRFVQTLQWKGQQLACREIGNEYITQYSSWYYECKGICEAKKDVSYCPGSCKVTIPLQAMKGVDESPAFLALKAEVADIINRCKIDLGKQYLKLRGLNNERKKINLTELLAKSLPRLAESQLIDSECKEYGKHNLVADLLLLHHHQLLRSHTPLQRFIDVYKRVNGCGRTPADHMELYRRRFPEQTAPSETAKNDSASTRASTATAVAAANCAPPPSDTARKSSEGAPRSLSFEESAAAKEPSMGPTTVDSNMIPPSTSKTPSQSIAAASADSDLKTLLCRVLAIGSKDSPAIQQLLHSYPEIAEVTDAGKKLNSVGQQSTSNFPSTPTKTPKPSKPVKHLSPPRCMWNPYKRCYYFTREETEEEKTLLFASVTKAERILDCEYECVLNSIREKNFVDASEMPPAELPDKGPPPDFAEPLAEGLPMEVVTNALQANPASNVMKAVDSLWRTAFGVS